MTPNVQVLPGPANPELPLTRKRGPKLSSLSAAQRTPFEPLVRAALLTSLQIARLGIECLHCSELFGGDVPSVYQSQGLSNLNVDAFQLSWKFCARVLMAGYLGHLAKGTLSF